MLSRNTLAGSNNTQTRVKENKTQPREASGQTTFQGEVADSAFPFVLFLLGEERKHQPLTEVIVISFSISRRSSSSSSAAYYGGQSHQHLMEVRVEVREAEAQQA